MNQYDCGGAVVDATDVLNFDFETVELLGGLLKITLKQQDANTMQKRPSFSWVYVSQKEKIAVARGAGGGIALWQLLEG